MLSASQIRFVVLLVAFSHALANDTYGYGADSEIRCNWNCTVVESDQAALKQEMKTSISKKKFIRLGIRYEKTVDDKCANKTFANSSKIDVEYSQVCLVNKQLSSLTTVIENFPNFFLEVERKEITAICTFNPASTSGSNPSYYSSCSSAVFSQSHLADFGAEFNSIDCNAVETDNLRPSMNIIKSNGINSPMSEGNLKSGGWRETVFNWLFLVFLAVFIYYSLAFLCLFSPTEVTQDGVRQIILEGASPVSFRSLVGNFFFSGDNGKIWHKTKTFILRFFIIPLPFLFPAIFVDFKLFGLLKMQSFQRLMVECSVCYLIQAFYISFCTKRSLKPKPCFVCKVVKPGIHSCQDELPRLILNHLRIQPLVLVECWRLFKRCLLIYLKMLVMVLPSSKVSIVSCLRFLIFIALLFLIPVVIMVLLIVACLLALHGIILTSPVLALCNTRYRVSKVNVPFVILFFIRIAGIALSVFATVGACILLILAAIGTLLFLLYAFLLSFSEETLPYVACFVFVLYYVWSSYSSFTKKYHELALAIFYCYKNSRHSQFKDIPPNGDQEQKLPSAADNNDNIMAISKELFDMACEELMPLREGVCILILKVTIIVSSVLTVFSLTMLSSFDATPIMKTLLTFLTLSFPKIVAIYVDGGWQKKLQAMVINEKVPKIVEQFINETSGSFRRQGNSSASIDEVILVNEEGVELVNM